MLNVDAHLKKMHFSASCKTSLYTLGIQTQRTIKTEQFHLSLFKKLMVVDSKLKILAK